MMMMAAASFVSSHHPIPRQPGSREDLGPFLNVVTWILLITSALAVLTRLITKRAMRRSMDFDDAFVVLALVRGVAKIFVLWVHAYRGYD
jgi:ABC-type dipeptide/oligopeptide/nickel transport system permease component